MDPDAAAVQTYQCKCATFGVEPLPSFLDAVATGAVSFAANTVSLAHLEALVSVLPDTKIRSVEICHTMFSCQSWALLVKAFGRVRWEHLSLSSSDLSAINQRALGSDCRRLRTESLGMCISHAFWCLQSKLRRDSRECCSSHCSVLTISLGDAEL